MDAPSGWVSFVLSTLAVLISLSSALFQRRQTVLQRRQTVLQERTSQAEAIGHFIEGEEVLTEAHRLRDERRKLASTLKTLESDSVNSVAIMMLDDPRQRELLSNREYEKELEQQKLGEKILTIEEQEKKLMRKACNKLWQAINKGSEKSWVASQCLILGDLCYRELEDRENARTAYQIGLQYNEQDWKLHFSFGILLEEENANLRQALRHFRRAAKLAPSRDQEKCKGAVSRIEEAVGGLWWARF